MITTAQMYWLTRLDSIKCFLEHSFEPTLILSAIVLVVIVVGLHLYCVHELGDDSFCVNQDAEKKRRELKSHLHRIASRCLKAILALVTAGVMCSGLNAMIPTTREMAAIVIVPKIANSEKVQTAGNKLCDLALEWMEALRPQKGGGAE